MAQVLIIDDSSFSRKMLRRMVEAAGHSVLDAGGGRQGLEMIKTAAIDCILLDLTMPDLDGLGVLAELQKMNNSIPVVVHTADVQERSRTQCLALGAHAVLQKPFNEMDMEGLLGVLSNATRKGAAA
jgi:CheY-like chemotaxis protein